MARLIQANVLISDHGEDGYRVFGRLHYSRGTKTYSLDVDEYVVLHSGDPKINGQLEDIVLHFAESIFREEKAGYPREKIAPHPRA